MSRSHRQLPTLLVLLASLSAAGCSADQTLNALARAIDASVSGDLPPDSLFLLHPSLAAQQGASLAVMSAPGASLASVPTEALGENLSLGDNLCVRVTMDFAFTFYGVTYTRPYICPNGNITLNTANPDATARIPNSTMAIVAPATADWVPDDKGNVYVQTIGTAPTRRYIVTWHNVRLKRQSTTGQRSTFRAILHETSNLVELHYPSLIREVRVDAMKAAISGGPKDFIVAASGDELFALSGTSICYTPTGPMSYEERREPCPVLAPPNTAPVAVVGGPFQADEGTSILFDGSASWDADQDALTYAWAFGDGGASAEAMVAHTFVDDGEFAVTLTVTDPQGLTSEASTAAHVRNVSPAVVLAQAPSIASLARGPTPFATIVSGETAELSASFSDPGVGDAPWSWSVDWGATIGATDAGTTADQAAPIVVSRRIVEPGTHTVTLVVEDKDGGRSTAFGTLAVHPLSLELDMRPGRDDGDDDDGDDDDGDDDGGDDDDNQAAESNDALRLNIRSRGTFWIAIRTTPSVGAADVLVSSVQLGGASVVTRRGVPRARLEDVDGDGDRDLLLQFETQDLVRSGAVGPLTQTVSLVATLRDGRRGAGVGAVRIVGR